MGLVGQLVVDVLSSLLQVWNLVCGPCLVEGVQGSDVVDDSLVSRIQVLVAVYVKSCVQCATRVGPSWVASAALTARC